MNKDITQIVVNNTDNNKRLDIFVSEKYGISRSAAQKLAAGGNISVDGASAKSNLKLKASAVVIISYPSKEEASRAIPTVYEDSEIIVIDKPAGITVHPAPGERGLTVAELLPQPIFVVHRLDKGTSGVMVFAKTERSATLLKKQFHDRKVKKVYKALVGGDISEDTGSIDISLGRSLNSRGKIIPVHEGKGAVTDFKVLQRYHDFTLVDAMPKTGRTHQIRTHFAAIGHPLYGDIRYGGGEHKRIFLHAYSLTITSPVDGRKQEFISPLPEELKAITSAL